MEMTFSFFSFFPFNNFFFFLHFKANLVSKQAIGS